MIAAGCFALFSVKSRKIKKGWNFFVHNSLLLRAFPCRIVNKTLFIDLIDFARIRLAGIGQHIYLATLILAKPRASMPSLLLFMYSIIKLTRVCAETFLQCCVPVL
jgi:hypothetical protein